MPAGKKSQTVETTGSRTRLNIMGALNLNDIGSTVVRENDSINSLNIARFFIAIQETYPIRQKIHIVLDGAGYHRAELVKDRSSRYTHLHKSLLKQLLIKNRSMGKLIDL